MRGKTEPRFWRALGGLMVWAVCAACAVAGCNRDAFYCGSTLPSDQMVVRSCARPGEVCICAQAACAFPNGSRFLLDAPRDYFDVADASTGRADGGVDGAADGAADGLDPAQTATDEDVPRDRPSYPRFCHSGYRYAGFPFAPPDLEWKCVEAAVKPSILAPGATLCPGQDAGPAADAVADADASISADPDASIDADADVSIDADADASIDAEADVSIDADADASIDADARVDADASSDMRGDISADPPDAGADLDMATSPDGTQP